MLDGAGEGRGKRAKDLGGVNDGEGERGLENLRREAEASAPTPGSAGSRLQNESAGIVLDG